MRNVSDDVILYFTHKKICREKSNSKLEKKTIIFCGVLSLNDKHFKEMVGIVSIRRIIKVKQKYRMQD